MSNFIFYLLVSTFVLLGCMDVDNTPGEPSPDPDPDPIPQYASISGSIREFLPSEDNSREIASESLYPLIQDGKIKVTAGNYSVFANEYGFFSIENILISKDGNIVVSFQHTDGTYTNSVKVIPAKDGESYDITTLLARTHFSKPIPSDGKISVIGFGDFQFPKDLAGANVSLYFGDPTGNNTDICPGNGKSTEDKFIEASIFFEIVVSNEQGVITQPSSPVGIQIRLPEKFQSGEADNPRTGNPFAEGDTISLYSLNSNGLWQKEDAFPSDPSKDLAEIIRGPDGFYLSAQLAHLSSWAAGEEILTNTFGALIVNEDGEGVGDVRGRVYQCNYYTLIPDWARSNSTGWMDFPVKVLIPPGKIPRTQLAFLTLNKYYDVTESYEGNVELDEFYGDVKWGDDYRKYHGLINKTIVASGKVKVVLKNFKIDSLIRPYVDGQNRYAVVRISEDPQTISLGVLKYKAFEVSISCDKPAYFGLKTGIMDSSEIPMITFDANTIRPQTRITYPTSGTTLEEGVYTITAQCQAGTSAIQKIEFFDDNTYLGVATEEPYQFSYKIAEGTHTLRTRVYDLDDNMSWSPNVYLTATKSNPTIELISPSSGEVLTTQSIVDIEATANDRELKLVFFQSNGSWIYSSYTPPFSIQTQFNPGTYEIVAVAQDNLGNRTVSKSANIEIKDGPIATLTGVVDGCIYAPGPSIVLAATVDKPEDTAAVAFYSGSTKLGEIAAPGPYTMTWENVPTAHHLVKAWAISHTGVVGKSKVANIYVTTAFNTSLIKPNNTSEEPNTDILVQAAANSPDGVITKVEFYQDSTLLGEDTEAPFEVTWKNVSKGVYSLKTIATNAYGNKAVSPVVKAYVVGKEPYVDSVQVSKNLITRGDLITINGVNFDGAVIHVGSALAVIQSVTNTQVVCTLLNEVPSGIQDIIIQNSYGTVRLEKAVHCFTIRKIDPTSRAGYKYQNPIKLSDQKWIVFRIDPDSKQRMITIDSSTDAASNILTGYSNGVITGDVFNQIYFCAVKFGSYTDIVMTDGVTIGKLAHSNEWGTDRISMVTNSTGCYFVTTQLSTLQHTLWKFDGHNTTSFVGDGMASSVFAIPDRIYASIWCTGFGFEMCHSDGNSQFSLLHDVNIGYDSSSPSFMVMDAQNDVFFYAYTGDFTGYALYKTTGPSNFTLLKDFTSEGGRITSPYIHHKGVTYFTRENVELWKSDGTPSGTVRVKTFGGIGRIQSHCMIKMGDYVYFMVEGSLYRTDGTESGTTKLFKIVSSEQNLDVFRNGYQGNDFFTIKSLYGTLYSDGTLENTYMFEPDEYTTLPPDVHSTSGGTPVYFSHETYTYPGVFVLRK